MDGGWLLAPLLIYRRQKSSYGLFYECIFCQFSLGTGQCDDQMARRMSRQSLLFVLLHIVVRARLKWEVWYPSER